MLEFLVDHFTEENLGNLVSFMNKKCNNEGELWEKILNQCPNMSIMVEFEAHSVYGVSWDTEFVERPLSALHMLMQGRDNYWSHDIVEDYLQLEKQTE